MADQSPRSGLAAVGREDRAAMGIGLVLLAYFLFSCIDSSAKWLALAGFPAVQIAFMRYAAHFVISTTLVRDGGLSGLDRRHILWLCLRGALIMLSTVCNFIALRYLPLTLTATILFSAPIWVCILSWPLLGERVGPWRSAAIVLGFIGIVVAIAPSGEGFNGAVIFSLLAALSFALYVLLTRRLAGIVSTNAMQFFSGLVGAAALAPFALAQWQAPANGQEWLLLALLGLFGWAGHQFLTTAHRFAPASTLSPFSYSFILYLTAWSYILFSEIPTSRTIAGAVIITIAGLIIWYRERPKKVLVSRS